MTCPNRELTFDKDLGVHIDKWNRDKTAISTNVVECRYYGEKKYLLLEQTIVEVWTLNANLKRMWLALEKGYLQSTPRTERKEMKKITERMDARDMVTDRIKRRGLKWFGYILKTPGLRWPNQIGYISSTADTHPYRLPLVEVDNRIK